MPPLHRLYAESMREHPYGYALYKPVSNTIMKPGSVGIFLSDGSWHPVTSLDDDPAVLIAEGLSPPSEPLSRAPTEKISGWSPKLSSDTVQYTGHFSVGADGLLTGLPVNASLQYKYTTASDFGAVLITSPPITHEGFYFESPFRNWVKNNAKALLAGRRGEDIAEHGLFVVTQTYACARGSLTAWNNPRNEVFVGFDVGATGVGELGPHGGWIKGQSRTGWIDFASEREGELKVVFACGLWYRKRTGWPGRLDQTAKPQDRGTKETLDSVLIVDGEQGYYLNIESFGQPPEPEDQDEVNQSDDVDI